MKDQRENHIMYYKIDVMRIYHIYRYRQYHMHENTWYVVGLHIYIDIHNMYKCARVCMCIIWYGAIEYKSYKLTNSLAHIILMFTHKT